MDMGNFSRDINGVRYEKKRAQPQLFFPIKKYGLELPCSFAVQPIFPPWGKTLKLNLGAGMAGEAQRLFPSSKLLSPEKARLASISTSILATQIAQQGPALNLKLQASGTIRLPTRADP